MTETWPWLTVAGLGAFHGLNPAMGWLFAVALGLHKSSHRVMLIALLPVAIGHALAVASAVALLLLFGLLVRLEILKILCAVLLLAWALKLAIKGHRGRVRTGMKVTLTGLLLWSFSMAYAHGAGLMLLPTLFPLDLSASASSDLLTISSVPLLLAALLLHTVTMLTTATAAALIVYHWFGIGVLRRGWINVNRLWIAILVLAAVWLLLS